MGTLFKIDPKELYELLFDSLEEYFCGALATNESPWDMLPCA
jgi:hypothetical protein